MMRREEHPEWWACGSIVRTMEAMMIKLPSGKRIFTAHELARSTGKDAKMDNLARPVHKFCLYRDGNAWCAVGPGFVDMMASPVGFGLEQIEAVREFQAAWRRPRSNQRDLTVADFTICSDNPRVSGEGATDWDKVFRDGNAHQMAKPFEDRNFE